MAGRATGYDIPDHLIVLSDISSLKRYIKSWDNDFNDNIKYAGHNKRNHYTFASQNTFKNSTIKQKENTKIKPIIIKKKSFSEIQAWFKNNPRYGKGPKNKHKNKNGFYTCMTQNDKKEKVRDKREFQKLEKDNTWGFGTEKSKDKNKNRTYSMYSDTNDNKTLEWWSVCFQ